MKLTIVCAVIFVFCVEMLSKDLPKNNLINCTENADNICMEGHGHARSYREKVFDDEK